MGRGKKNKHKSRATQNRTELGTSEEHIKENVEDESEDPIEMNIFDAFSKLDGIN